MAFDWTLALLIEVGFIELLVLYILVALVRRSFRKKPVFEQKVYEPRKLNLSEISNEAESIAAISRELKNSSNGRRKAKKSG